MDKKTAIQIINEAIDIAITKGCYNLPQVNNIINALNELYKDNLSIDPD
jgi:hypothetical protein